MYDGQTCGNIEIQCTNASGVDVLGHHGSSFKQADNKEEGRSGLLYFGPFKTKMSQSWTQQFWNKGGDSEVNSFFFEHATGRKRKLEKLSKQLKIKIRARNGRRWGRWRRPGQARCYPTHCWWICRFLFAFLCKILTRWQEANIDEGYCLILLKSCQNLKRLPKHANIANNICPYLFEYAPWNAKKYNC